MPRTTWTEFSRLFLKFHELPRGFTLGLHHKDGRKARTNMAPERKPVKREHLARLDDHQTVHAMLEAAKELFPDGSKVLGLRWGLYDLSGKLVAPRTHLGTVRALEGAPSEEEREQAEFAEQRATELQRLATADISDLEELEDAPHETVPRAYVDALVERFDVAAVRDALARHLTPQKRGGR